MYRVRASPRLSLGSLHALHEIYKRVAHDEIPVTTATQELVELLDASRQYKWVISIALSFALSALICPLAFSGSFADMWFAGIAGAVLQVFQANVINNNVIYSSVIE